MDERKYGDIIQKYPELIEENLTFIGREVRTEGDRRIDLLFKDEIGRKLIVELKVVPINDKHIGQVVRYLGALNDPNARIMLVSPVIPTATRRALEYQGVGYVELTFQKVLGFLEERGDESFNVAQADIEGAFDDLGVKAIKKTNLGNEIRHTSSGFSKIKIIDHENLADKYKISKRGITDSIEFKTTEYLANLYLRIENALYDNNIKMTTELLNTQRNFGFSRSYKKERESIDDIDHRTLWFCYDTSTEQLWIEISVNLLKSDIRERLENIHIDCNNIYEDFLRIVNINNHNIDELISILIDLSI